MSRMRSIPREYAEIKRYRDGANGKTYLGYKVRGTIRRIENLEPNRSLPNYKVYVALYGSALTPRMLNRCEGELTEYEDGSVEYSELKGVAQHPICCFVRESKTGAVSRRQRYKRASIPSLLPPEEIPNDVPYSALAYAAKNTGSSGGASGPLETYADMYAALFKLSP